MMLLIFQDSFQLIYFKLMRRIASASSNNNKNNKILNINPSLY